MFNDKVALVTGGGSGMGASTARRLAAEGAAVVVADLRQDAAAETVARIAAEGGKAIAVVADIAQEADNARMFDEAKAAFGAIDAAFLNAAILQPYVPFEEVSVELWDRIMAVNLRGTFLGVRETLKHLRPGGSCVVNASAAGWLGFAEAAAYSTSKHALIGLVRSAAAAFAARDLRINAVLPGIIMTPMNGFPSDQPIQDPDTLGNPPYRGHLLPQHVTEVVLFLLSCRAAGINGHAQIVDAGLLAAFPPLPQQEPS